MSERTLRPGLIARLFGRATPPPAPAVEAAPVSLFPAAPTAAAVAPPAAPATEAAVEVLFFNIVASNGRMLGAGTLWGRLIAGSDWAAALLFVTTPGLLGQMGLLLAPAMAEFALWPDTPLAAARALVILPTDLAGVVRLRDPLAVRGSGFLSLRTKLDGDQPDVCMDSTGSALEATFSLLAIPANAIPAGAAAAAGEFGLAAAEGLGLTTVLARLRDGRLRPELAEAVLRLLPRADLAELGRHLLERPDDLAFLQKLLPRDTWLGRVLPALRDWNARPAPATGILQSPAGDDRLLPQAGEEMNLPLGLVLNSLARGAVLPRRGACLLTTVRNEGPYLLDWLSYHFSLGFEHAFVYSNENTDGSDTLLELLARHGAITWIQNARGTRLGPQTKAYAHALMMLPDILDYRWAAILDLDEYMALDAAMFSSLPEFLALQESQRVDAIAMCWLIFVGLPGEAWHDQSSIRRFLRRERDANQHVKSLFRPRQFWNAQPHYPYAVLDAPFDYRFQDGSVHHDRSTRGRLPAFAAAPAATQAWINHYFLRTADEAVWKLARGRGDWADESQRTWFLHFIAKTFLELSRPERLVEDRRILAYAAGQADALARLRALPGVAACDDAVKAAFAGQIALARADFLSRPPADGEPAEVAHFRDIVSMVDL